MRHWLSWFLILLFSLGWVSCQIKTPKVDWIPLRSDYMHNGSVSMYSIKNKLGDILVYYKNHVLIEAGNYVISQEYTGQTEEFTRRLRLDGSTLNMISYEIVQDNTEVDKSKTTINQLQFVMLTGKKTNQTYFITDFQDEKPKYSRLFIGNFFIENDFLLTLLSAFPFEELSYASYNIVSTVNKKNSVSSFTVTGKEKILYKRKMIPTYRVNFPTEKSNAWFSQEIPHMLIKAEFPDRTIELVDWNEI